MDPYSSHTVALSSPAAGEPADRKEALFLKRTQIATVIMQISISAPIRIREAVGTGPNPVAR